MEVEKIRVLPQGSVGTYPEYPTVLELDRFSVGHYSLHNRRDVTVYGCRFVLPKGRFKANFDAKDFSRDDLLELFYADNGVEKILYSNKMMFTLDGASDSIFGGSYDIPTNEVGIECTNLETIIKLAANLEI